VITLTLVISFVSKGFPYKDQNEELFIIIRERTTWARTDTIQYAYSSIHNGRYRYEYSLCHGVLATYIIRPGRLLRERCLYAMGSTLHL